MPEEEKTQLVPDEILRYPLNLQDEANNGIIKITIKERRASQIMKHIFLPMPTGFNISDGASFTNFERSGMSMGAKVIEEGVAGFLSGGVQGGLDAMGLNSRGAGMDDITGGASAFAADTAALGLLYFGGMPLGAGQMAQEAAFTAGAAIDKGARSRFQENTIREYNLTIQMSPKSEKENQAIDKIIKMLRGYSYANRGTNTFALDYPPEVLVEFYHGPGKINEFMPVLMPSYLKSVATTYNPNTFGMHADGGMEQYDLALSFGEIKRLTRDELEVLESNKLSDNRHNELYLEQQLIAAGLKTVENKVKG